MNSKINYNAILDNLNGNTNFSFSRFGDGELNAIFEKKGANCDGHEYFADMGVRLKNILNSEQKYYLGLQSLGYGIWKQKVDEIIKANKLVFSDADILHTASIKGQLKPFIEALNNRNVIFVAPEYLIDGNVINCYSAVIIPEKNCWNYYENIKNTIINVTNENDVIVYSASMMANVLIDDMYKEFGETITQIDCGSVFDPYVGVSKRRYHNSIIERENGN